MWPAGHCHEIAAFARSFYDRETVARNAARPPLEGLSEIDHVSHAIRRQLPCGYKRYGAIL